MGDKLVIIILGVFLVFAIPYVTTSIIQGRNMTKQQSIKSVKSGMNVCISEAGEYELIDVEEYLVYALAGKAEPDWNDEMLKVMAVVLRTSIYYEMENHPEGSSGNGSNIINEDELFEIRYGENELKKKYEDKYNAFMTRICDAVLQTKGQAITYNSSYIMPVYHNVSVGQTVSAKELYGVDIPYLQSVDSKADIDSDNFSETIIYNGSRIKKEFSDNDYMDICLDTDNADEKNESAYSEDEFEIIKATKSGFAEEINVFGRVVDGRTFANVMNLKSTNIHIDETKEGYKIIAIGQGSSIGLSLYGAEVLSKNGMDYKDIIKYYYTGVEVEN